MELNSVFDLGIPPTLGTNFYNSIETVLKNVVQNPTDDNTLMELKQIYILSIIIYSDYPCFLTKKRDLHVAYISSHNFVVAKNKLDFLQGLYLGKFLI